MKKLFLALCLAATQAAIAQNADIRIGTLINESNWFELKRTIETTPRDSLSPLLYRMGTAMTAHYFNRPDSACTAIGTLLNDHQAEMGGQNSVHMVSLMATNLTRCGRYEEAAALTPPSARRPTSTRCMPMNHLSVANSTRQVNITFPLHSTTTCTRDTRSRDTS